MRRRVRLLCDVPLPPTMNPLARVCAAVEMGRRRRCLWNAISLSLFPSSLSRQFYGESGDMNRRFLPPPLLSLALLSRNLSAEEFGQELQEPARA